MGIPNYLFKKHKVTYYENPWQHTLFYALSIVALFVVYRSMLFTYFSSTSYGFIITILSIFILWLILPKFYKKDYFTRGERLRYQLPKFFEVLFQQVCILAGLLTFGMSPFIFGLIFFTIHIPSLFFIPKKFALFFTGGALFGGIIFSQLQYLGIQGFLLSTSIHLFFYIVFHYSLSRKHFLGEKPHKR
jgi:hypothetical protein